MNKIVLESNYLLTTQYRNLNNALNKHIRMKKRLKRHRVKLLNEYNLNDVLINNYEDIHFYRVNKLQIYLKNEYLFNLNKNQFKLFYNILIIKKDNKTIYYLINKDGSINYNISFETFHDIEKKYILKLLNLKRLLKAGGK